MPTITASQPILDSNGQPASGFIRVSASRPFETDKGLVTTAWAVARVNDGVPTVNGAPWSLPATPDSVWMNLEQELDGEVLKRFRVYVPEVDSLSYSDLLSNRAGTALGWGTYWWELTGDIEFPPEALDGDMGIDLITGDVWRNQA